MRLDRGAHLDLGGGGGETWLLLFLVSVATPCALFSALTVGIFPWRHTAPSRAGPWQTAGGEGARRVSASRRSPHGSPALSPPSAAGLTAGETPPAGNHAPLPPPRMSPSRGEVFTRLGLNRQSSHLWKSAAPHPLT